MKKIFFLLCVVHIAFSQNTKKDELYIRRFAKIAIEEMQKHKIPASVKLGQGLLETADGQSELARNANNHFGIKCKETWTGETYRYTDDAYMECFRKYENADDSYRDHSLFLTTRKHYSSLFTLPITDYKAWAFGLKKAGYATNPKYPQILIGRIEKYKLHEFDKVSVEELNAKLDELYPETKSETTIKISEIQTEIPTQKPVIEEKKIEIIKEPSKPKNIKSRILTHENKDLKYIVVQKGETIKLLSKWFSISINDLKNYNDLESVELIKENQKLFLENKRKKGKEKYYTVQKGDSMYLISQNQAIELSELYRRNKLKVGEEPIEGEILNLRGRIKSKPQFKNIP